MKAKMLTFRGDFSNVRQSSPKKSLKDPVLLDCTACGVDFDAIPLRREGEEVPIYWAAEY